MRRIVMVLTVGVVALALTASMALAANRSGSNGNDILYGTGGR